MAVASRDRTVPDWTLEAAAADAGLQCVAGVDEAGRGCLFGPVFAAAVRSLAPEGRFVTCGVTAGHMGELHLGQLFVKGITLMGVGRPDNQRIAATMRGLLAMIGQSQVDPVIAAVYSLEEIAEAHRLMESSEFFGKIVLVP